MAAHAFRIYALSWWRFWEYFPKCLITCKVQKSPELSLRSVDTKFFLPLRSVTEIRALGGSLLIKEIVFEWNFEGSQNIWGWKDIALLNPCTKHFQPEGFRGFVLALNISKDGNSMFSHFLLTTPRALCSQSSGLSLCVCEWIPLFEQAAVHLRMTSVPWTLWCVHPGQFAGLRPLCTFCFILLSVCHLQRVNCDRVSQNYGFCDYNKAVV